MTYPNRNALLAGLAVSSGVIGCVYLGSRGLRHFDPAVFWYAVGAVLAAFAVGWRFAVWAQRPPSRMYFLRGMQLLWRRARGGNSLSAMLMTGEKSLGSRTHCSLVPPHPRPLPKGEGEFSAASRLVEESQFVRMRDTEFPLPEGEGQGEGERSAIPPEAKSNPRTLLLAQSFIGNFVAQNLIRKRSLYRWIMHLCLSGGCTLAFAITFPLVFGWIHFESFADNAEMFRVQVFGFTVDSFDVHSTKAFLAFNLLNVASVIVLIGLGMAAWRRLTDAGERATQRFGEDILPLLLIFAVTASGLMLTVSYKVLAGRGHSLIAIAHTISVVALICYIPFGKLFHIFQRVCSLCVSLYQKSGEAGPRAHCRRCSEEFASQMHVDDLKIMLDQLGFHYCFATAHGDIHYQDICPPCRRRLVGLNQGKTIGR